MRIGQGVTNPGELRTKIALVSRVTQQDAGGFPVQGNPVVIEVWGRWTNVHGSETWAADAAGAVKPATVLIRYHAGLDETWSVAVDGKTYEIVSVDDIGLRHEYMELKVRRSVAG